MPKAHRMPNRQFTRSPLFGEDGRRIPSGMSSLPHACRLAAVLCCAGGALTLPLRVTRAQEQPELVTTDTPAYCMQLLDQVSSLVRVAPAPPPDEVTSLSTEGQRMCVHGQTRGGILRLRRALMLMRQLVAAP